MSKIKAGDDVIVRSPGGGSNRGIVIESREIPDGAGVKYSLTLQTPAGKTMEWNNVRNPGTVSKT